jgi:hypothetical protein
MSFTILLQYIDLHDNIVNDATNVIISVLVTLLIIVP